MSHPIPGHDYSERHNEETRSEYARRRGEAFGLVKHLPKERVEANRRMRRGIKKIHKVGGRLKALLEKRK